MNDYNCKLEVNNAKTRRYLEEKGIVYNVVKGELVHWIYISTEDAIRYLRGEF